MYSTAMLDGKACGVGLAGELLCLCRLIDERDGGGIERIGYWTSLEKEQGSWKWPLSSFKDILEGMR